MLSLSLGSPVPLPGGSLSYQFVLYYTMKHAHTSAEMLAYVIRLFYLATCLSNHPYWYLETHLILGESRMAWIYCNSCNQFSTDNHLHSFSLANLSSVVMINLVHTPFCTCASILVV